jgi:colanic acid biosynthesis glycosyl transferase WcaI
VRILIVSQYFYPENFRINQLAVALKESGHEVVILTAQPNYPSGEFTKGYGNNGPWNEIYDGMKVLRVPIYPRGRGRSWELVLNYISFVFSTVLFGLPRLRGRYDVCISWCSSPITGAIPACIYRFVTRTPVAVWVQDLWPETFFAVTKSHSRILRLVLSSVVKWIYRRVDQIWVQSPAYEESVLKHGGRAEQILFVPNWAEDLYDCGTWQSVTEDKIPPNSLVFAGNLGRAQGLETLIEAAAITINSVPQAHWVFVGDGTLREWLELEVKRRKLESHVTLLPRRKPNEMPNVLKPAAALLVTLGGEQVFAQTIPSKVQSCLAAGRPVIATLSGEPARVIEQAHCGFVVPPLDPSRLAKTVKDFFALPEIDRAKFGSNGHAYYSAHFTQKLVISKITDLLERMRTK